MNDLQRFLRSLSLNRRLKKQLALAIARAKKAEQELAEWKVAMDCTHRLVCPGFGQKLHEPLDVNIDAKTMAACIRDTLFSDDQAAHEKLQTIFNLVEAEDLPGLRSLMGTEK